MSATPQPSVAAPATGWSILTPGRVLPALLVIDGFLLLADHLHWLPKGHGVVLALAATALVVMLMLLAFCISLILRWRFQFSIRSLLMLTVAVAIPCSWIAVAMRTAAAQREAVEDLGKCEYCLCAGESDELAWMPYWLSGILGDDFFDSVSYVFLSGPHVTDASLERLHQLPDLQKLNLDGTQITDAGLRHLKRTSQLRELYLNHSSNVSDAALEHLRELAKLRELGLYGTRVTRDGVKKLQLALPDCKIEPESPTPD